MRNTTEKSFGSKYRRNNPDYPCRFSATRWSRHILCYQRHITRVQEESLALTKQHVWYKSGASGESLAAHYDH